MPADDTTLDLSTITDKNIGQVVSVNLFNTHPEYNKMLPIWTRNRDAVEGEDAIKARGTTYLPKPNGQKNSEYLKYLQRAQYFNGSGRTLSAYEGMIFRKNPIYNYKSKDEKDPLSAEAGPEAQKKKDTYNAFFENITCDGKSANQFLREIVKEVMAVNKVGVLIDFPVLSDKAGVVPVMSKKEYEARKLHPVASLYKAESIKNWSWELIDTNVVPRVIVLQEKTDGRASYATLSSAYTDSYRYRVLLLEDYVNERGESTYRYKQIIFESSDANSYKVASVIYPIANGEYINHIPFYILTDIGLDYRANVKSMISDLVTTNIGHFINSADWENELHWVGIKTLYLPGWNLQVNGQPRLGGAMAGPRDTVPQLIEASSDSGIKDEMQRKEERMAVLGAERISQQGRYIASKETARINAQSESATLSSMSSSLSESMSDVFSFLLDWAGFKDVNVSVDINKDFYEDDLSGEELLKWIESVQNGGASFEMYYFNMDKKEAFPPDWSMDKERAALEKANANTLGLGDEKAADLQAQLDEVLAGLAALGIKIINPEDDSDVKEEVEEADIEPKDKQALNDEPKKVVKAKKVVKLNKDK